MQFFDANALLGWLGHWAVPGIFLVMFTETGLLVGFLLPGDSLLLTAGLLSAAGTGESRLSLPWVLAAAGSGALLGSQTGYLIGRRAGRTLLGRSRNRQLAKAVDRTERLLVRVGLRRALIGARFVPVVRTVMGPTAGAIGVPARFYLLWQAVGGVLWTAGTTLLAYTLGRTVPGVEHLIDPAIAVTALLLPATIVVQLVRDRLRRRGSRREPESAAVGGSGGRGGRGEVRSEIGAEPGLESEAEADAEAESHEGLVMIDA